MKKLKVGISYATEQQAEIEEFVKELAKLEIDYFYDKEHPYLFWGEYKPKVLSDIYNNVDCVVAFVSREYLHKTLPRFEMEVSFMKQMETADGSYYFLPILYNDVKMPNYFNGNFHIWRQKYSLSELAKIVENKLKLIGKRNNDILNFKSATCKYARDLNNITIISKKSKNFDILNNSNKNRSLKFRYNRLMQEYFVYDALDRLKAVLSLSSNAIKIINYGLLPGIAQEYSFDEFLKELQEIIM